MLIFIYDTFCSYQNDKNTESLGQLKLVSSDTKDQ